LTISQNLLHFLYYRETKTKPVATQVPVLLKKKRVWKY